VDESQKKLKNAERCLYDGKLDHMGEGFLFPNAIDLGCGTGLSGNTIASITQQVTHKSI